MPKRTNEFQRLVWAVQKAVLPLSGVRMEESALVTDRLGNKREIDILVTIPAGAYELVVALEVRKHKRVTDVQWIDALAGKSVSFPGISRWVAVSSSGFTAKAQADARAHGIETIHLHEISEYDWLNGQRPFVARDFEGIRFAAVTMKVRHVPIADGSTFNGDFDTLLFSFAGRAERIPASQVARTLKDSSFHLIRQDILDGKLPPKGSAEVVHVYDGARCIAESGEEADLLEIGIELRWEKLDFASSDSTVQFGAGVALITEAKSDGVTIRTVGAFPDEESLNVVTQIEYADGRETRSISRELSFVRGRPRTF